MIILGKAPVSVGDGDTVGKIEGFSSEGGFGKYGGIVPNDNSGVLRYVSIRYSGANLGEGNEINGLTLGGVGSGTVVDHVEVYTTLDDGVELFGGTVNLSNVVVYNQGDDGIDIDQGYSGSLDNFLVVHGISSVATDEGLEIDGPEGKTHLGGEFTLSNGTVKSLGESPQPSPADFKSGCPGHHTKRSF